MSTVENEGGKQFSIPLVFASTNWFMTWLADFIGVLPKAYIAPCSFVYTAMLACGSYFGSLFATVSFFSYKHDKSHIQNSSFFTTAIQVGLL